MPNTDERIVSMKFDNAQFENGVSTSIKSIDKLNQALRFEGVSDSFDQISRAARKVDLSGAQSNVDSFLNHLSIQSIAKINVISNLITDVYQKGKKLINDIFVAPKKDGFNEYELKMGSVQTIMASTGETLDVVNDYLAELNTYADRTIYSFKDMTSSIGKFTNAGVKLEDAVLAIKGVSNEAAVSGANANEASRAMYNFAQALSAGYVKLIDWKSIENANMATVEFKKELINTAVELGTVVKEGDKYRSVTKDLNGKVSELFTETTMFNDSLSAQWMTTDVLVKTLGRYADESTNIGKKAYAAAQEVKTFSQLMDTFKEALGSGWAQSFEIVIGNFEEAKELFSTISGLLDHIVDISFKVQNGLLQMWKDNGGRDRLIKDIKTITNNLTTLSDKVVKTVLGPKYAKFIEDQADSTDKLSKSVEKYSAAEMEAARSIWYGENKYGNGEERVKNLEAAGLNAQKVQEYVEKLITSGWNLDTALENAKEDLAEISETEEKSDDQIGWNKWAKAFDHIVHTLKMVGTGIRDLGAAGLNVIKNVVEPFVEEFDLSPITWDIKEIAKRFMSFSARLKESTKQMTTLRTVVKFLTKLLNTLYEIVSPLIQFVYKNLYRIGDFLIKIGNAIDNFVGNKRRYAEFASIWSSINVIFNNFKESIKQVAKTFTDYIKSSNNPRLQKLLDFFKTLKDRVTKLLDVGLDLVVKYLDKLAKEGFGKFDIKGVDKVIAILDNLYEKIKKLISVIFGNTKDFFGGNKKTVFENVVKTAKTTFSDTDTKKKASEWISGVLSSITNAFKGFSFEKLLNMVKLGALVYSVYITKKSFDKLNKTISSFKLSITKVVDNVSGVLTAYQKKIKAQSLIYIAGAIAILSLSLIALSQVDSSKLYSASFAISIVILALSALMKAMSTFHDKDLGKTEIANKLKGIKISLIDIKLNAYATAATIFALTYALKTVVDAILEFKNIGWANYLGGVVEILGIIGALSVALALFAIIPAPEMGTILSILAFAAAITIIGKAVEKFIGLGLEKSLKGVAILGFSLLAITVAMKQLSGFYSAGLLKSAIGISIICVALNALIPLITAIVGLSSLNFEATMAAIASIAGLILAFALAAALASATNAQSTLVGLGAGIALMAVGLGVFGALGVPAIKGLKALTTTLIALIGVALIIKVLDLHIALMSISAALTAFSSSALIFSAAVFVCAVSIKILAKALPQLADGIVSFAEKITANVTVITNGIAAVITATCAAIAKSAPSIALALVRVVRSVFRAFATTLNTIWPEVKKLIFEFFGLARDIIPDLANMLIGAGIILINSLAAAVNDTSGAFTKAVFNLLESIFNLVLQVMEETLRTLNLDFLADEIEDVIDENTEQMERRTKEINKTLDDLGVSNADSYADGVERESDKRSKSLNIADKFLAAAKEKGENFDLSKVVNMDSTALGEMADEAGIISTDNIVKELSSGKIEEAYAEAGLAATDAYTMPEEYESVADINWNAYSEETIDRYPQTKEEGAEMSKEGAEGAESTAPLYKDAAHYLVTGFANEIRAGRMRVYAVGKVLAAAAKNAIDDQLDIDSPSKETAKSGMYTVLGFVKGIEDYQKQAVNAGEELGDETVQILKGPIERILDLLNGNLEFDPTIRPVLDTAELESGIQTANGLFGSTSYRLAGANASLNRVNAEVSSADIKMGSPDVVQAINELRGDFNEMSTKLDNLQVVMDSGALVGSIVGPMDSALGRRQIAKGRGN